MGYCGWGEGLAENEKEDLDDVVEALEVRELGVLAEDLGDDVRKLLFPGVELLGSLIWVGVFSVLDL